MSKNYMNDDVVEASRRAWNQLEGLFQKDPEFFEPENTEFALFYEQLLVHLLAEEKEE